MAHGSIHRLVLGLQQPASKPNKKQHEKASQQAAQSSARSYTSLSATLGQEG